MDRSELRETIQFLAGHPTTLTVRGSFEECCSFLIGIETGSGIKFLLEFSDWLGAKYELRPELTWFSKVLEVTTGSAGVKISRETSLIARKRLFELLEEFLDESEVDGVPVVKRP